ncbi:PREDICTED: loricrin-like [Chaetura pelagica]|uniref:loricrin-like n=1 Tax=Chaetura pelagica TaxID=8897 RepID=UPI000523679E|nr:PREDICTED: loricrin-like [Chaetura pelagica]
MKRIYQWLSRRCPRRNRGFNHEIFSHHRGGRSGNIHGRGSFFCDGEGSVIYDRGPSPYWPSSSTWDITGRYSCGGDGSVVITSRDSEGTTSWGISGGTVPTYGTGHGMGSSEDSGGGGGSSYHGGIRYDVSPRESALPTCRGGGGAGWYSGGSGYGTGGYSCPEFSSGGAGSSQDMQQKCPVVIPNIEPQQSKKTSQWPLSEKK